MKTWLKWILRGLGLMLLLVVAAVSYMVATGQQGSRPVGFQTISVPDPKGPPLMVGVWYPTNAAQWPMLLGLSVQWAAPDSPVAGKALPLVVISHGQGGGIGSHADTALGLASAGFVVAAPMHTGDNFADQSDVGGPKWFVDRARHISLTIGYMLARWHDHASIDASRIGMFGFSAGGTTALIAIGGQPDFARLAQHCAKAPEFACELWKPGKAPLPAPDSFAGDGRIKAAVIAAPGFGFAFVPDGLSNVHVPVQLWSGTADTHVPYATNVAPVAAALGPLATVHRVPEAGHFSFLVPCGPIGPPLLCHDAKGFDRAAFHKRFDAAVVAFFEAKLARH